MHVDAIKVIYKYVNIEEIDRALYGTSCKNNIQHQTTKRKYAT